MHIVLMDDDETLVRTLSRRLSQAGHQVTGFVTPVAVEALMALDADVYLLDLRFGSQSGLSFVAPLRAHCAQSRILIMTGFASIATAVQAVKLGADDYLTKPIDFSLLLTALTGPQETADNNSQLRPQNYCRLISWHGSIFSGFCRSNKAIFPALLLCLACTGVHCNVNCKNTGHNKNCGRCFTHFIDFKELFI